MTFHERNDAGRKREESMMELCRSTEVQAKELLRRLVLAQKIEMRGAGRASEYVEFTKPAETLPM